MESIIRITLNQTGKQESDNLLDWLFEKQGANGFTYEYWYITDTDEERRGLLEKLLESHKDLTDSGEIENFGFRGIFFPNLGDNSSPRYYLSKETVALIKEWTPFGLISQTEHSGFQNIKVFKGNKLIFASENQHDVGYLWLTKNQMEEFKLLNIPFKTIE